VLLATVLTAATLGAVAPLPAAAAAPAPPSDRAVAGQADRHDLTREQYYFVLPDRFANGDPGNHTGAKLPDGSAGTRMQNGFDPTDKGFYHGGDLAGVIDKLDYLTSSPR
jgi:hypothetical protein